MAQAARREEWTGMKAATYVRTIPTKEETAPQVEVLMEEVGTIKSRTAQFAAQLFDYVGHDVGNEMDLLSMKDDEDERIQVVMTCRNSELI
jgi:DNA-directed RNA polymerase sigma subunit (sigma70/sigma32)